MDIADQIREYRIKRGITQAQLAFELGVTVSTISNWEKDRSSPSPMAREKIKTWIQTPYNPEHWLKKEYLHPREISMTEEPKDSKTEIRSGTATSLDPSDLPSA